MKKEIKAELVAQAVIGYILLLLIVLAIYLIFALLVDLNIFSKQADQSTILTNLFIWSATLYTPFLAYMAYSDWKEQKHYDVVINTLNEMVDTVNKLTKTTKHAERYFSVTCFTASILNSSGYRLLLLINTSLISHFI